MKLVLFDDLYCVVQRLSFPRCSFERFGRLVCWKIIRPMRKKLQSGKHVCLKVCIRMVGESLAILVQPVAEIMLAGQMVSDKDWSGEWHAEGIAKYR